MTEQRAVLITGCSSGIGRCVAFGLKDQGYRVFATARRQVDVDDLGRAGFDSTQLDLANKASIAAAVEFVMQATGGRLYALFNNGAYGQPGAVEDLPLDALREQFEVNFFGTHELTRRVIPIMRQQGYGRIIQNSSVLGIVSLKYRGAYNASKHALEGLSDTLRMELRGSGIHVCLVEPGPITSNFRQNAHRAYLVNIDSVHSFHQDYYRAVEQRLQAKEAVVPFTLGPEAVLKKVIHALESSKPCTRYYVTFPAYLFSGLKRLLPSGWMDIILSRI